MASKDNMDNACACCCLFSYILAIVLMHLWRYPHLWLMTTLQIMSPAPSNEMVMRANVSLWCLGGTERAMIVVHAFHVAHKLRCLVLRQAQKDIEDKEGELDPQCIWRGPLWFNRWYKIFAGLTRGGNMKDIGCVRA